MTVEHSAIATELDSNFERAAPGVNERLTHVLVVRAVDVPASVRFKNEPIAG